MVRLAPQLTSGQVAKALEGVTGTKILTMQNALDAFKRFDEDQVGEGGAEGNMRCDRLELEGAPQGREPYNGRGDLYHAI